MEAKKLLEELRQKIDVIDFEILKLINQRMEHTLRTRKLKSKVVDRNREEEVIATIRNRSTTLIRPEFSEELYRKLIAESKFLQNKGLKLIGFQGEHGAYGEVAVNALERQLVPIPCLEFADVFEEVLNGQLDFGIVPVENSLAGAVTQVNDLLVEVDTEKITIIGEVTIPIHHCLLALPGTDYRDIKTVYSHSQALAQCRRFVDRHKFEPIPYYDTAGAAMMLSKDKPRAAAAIASKLCAELYNLEVLFEDIADNKTDSTRFLILSNQKSDKKGTKCSIVFSTEHVAGALFSIVKVFSEAGLNMTRIESRPIREDPGKFAFLLDFLGSDEDPKVREALEKIEKEAVIFKFLGCYS